MNNPNRKRNVRRRQWRVALLALLWPAVAAGQRADRVGEAPAAGRPPALVPAPREIALHGAASLAGGVVIARAARAADRFAARDLAASLRARRIDVTIGDGGAGGVRVTLLRVDDPAGRRALARAHLRFEPAMRDEGYVIVADGRRVDVIGATAAGVFYGVETLRQLVEGSGARARLRLATIRDWPAMRWRGLHDDLSRGPVPTLEFQKKQIRTFAAYKLNVYSPYFEHTLAYPSDPLVAPPGGAITPDQVRELVKYAARYHVSIVPEQEAFGHLHHVLAWEQYTPLAETPHGHVLAPGQAGSIPLIRQWFGAIDSLFPSRFVHLGADETFELGRGQTRERVEREGLGAVYVDFLGRIVEALRPTGKTFLFWGDMAMRSPELVGRLPRDMIAVAWEYNPQPRGFDRFLTPYTNAGMQTWVAPGVANWSRVFPDFAIALPDIQGFVRDGQRLGSTGMLNTTWDDDGESLFEQTWYAVLFGAAAAWQPGESSIEAFQRAYGEVFHGDTTGRIDQAERELMAAHALLSRAGVGDGSDRLYWLDPWSAEGARVGALVLPVAHELRLHAERAIVLIAEARAAAAAAGDSLREGDALDALELGARRMDLIGRKFQIADEAARLYADAYGARDDSTRRSAVVRDLADISGINGRFQDLRDAFALGRDLYERAWRAENRPYWLSNVLARYDIATQRWIERADRVTEARLTWSRTRELPSPDSIGFPPAPPPVASGGAR
ncbi:MAG TPA: glycoside hydrolase family 20 zincin-like fold domain-containing protein [Gemmatimonadaceae bacterium]